MTELDRAWGRAFAAQALSDLDARELLRDAAKCHRVHFLQMAAEKLCKAYIILQNGHAAASYSHAVIQRHLPAIARAYLPVRSQAATRSQISRLRQVAREVELLAPALGGSAGREDNCEYPWLDQVLGVQTPCTYSFPNLDDEDRILILFIKLLRTAAEAYAK